MPSAVLGALSAVAYGMADYAGGLAARVDGGATTARGAHLRGLFVAILALVIFGQGFRREALILGAGVGMASCLSLSLLFKALASGPSVTAAPIVAIIGAAVVVAWDAGNGFGIWKLLGLVSGLVSILLVSARSPTDILSMLRFPLVRTAIIAGLASGVALVALASVPTSGLIGALIAERVIVVRHEVQPTYCPC